VKQNGLPFTGRRKMDDYTKTILGHVINKAKRVRCEIHICVGGSRVFPLNELLDAHTTTDEQAWEALIAQEVSRESVTCGWVGGS
jgi:hypothetical protein